MITVELTTTASPDEVWSVLADGWLFPSWVVGASRMRAVNADWPAAGATLHHSVGVWPALLDDSTTVLECTPEQLLVLRARARPFGEAKVVVELESAPTGGCRMVMSEDVTSGPGRLMPQPLRWAALAPRNNESLRRLAFIAERRTEPGSPVEPVQNGRHAATT